MASYAAFSESLPGFLITISLVEAAFAFIDLFLWVTLAELASTQIHPYRIYGFGLFANVFAILAGGFAGNLLIRSDSSHFVLTGLFAAGAIFLTFLIMPSLLRRLEEVRTNHNNNDTTEPRSGLPEMFHRMPGAGSLTKREKEITLLLLQGLTNRETAATLSISENTLKTHIRNIYRKVGVTQKRELLSLAIDRTNKADEEELSS